MRQTFLQELASHYITQFTDESPSVCIVFPNRRASTFFRKALLELRPENQWLPDILSSGDFVKKISSLQIIDPVRALFELYQVYKSTEGDSADSFDVFSTWASQLIHDFQEIDLYCVDAKQLYSSVDAAYAMKNWSPDRSEIGKYQEQYLKFWSKMGVWYEKFRAHLFSNNLATAAMAYRRLAENIQTQELPWKHLIFAGFNALNTSEQIIIQHLEKRGKAQLIWDLDNYYLENEMHEAGLFARRFMQQTKKNKLYNTGNYLRNVQRSIEIIGVAKNIGQTFVAGSVLNKISENDPSLSQTALVLCDEQLLMPMLEVLPKDLKTANITMGYPLHLLPVSTLFSACLEMHIKARNFKTSDNKEKAFYYKDLLRLFRNPVFASLLPAKEISLLIQKVESIYDVFIPISKITHQGNSLNTFSFLFEDWNESPQTALDALIILSDKIRNHYSLKDKEEIGYELESLFEVSNLVNRIKIMLNGFDGTLHIRTVFRIFQQFLRQLNLPFLGEPLSGLQIMGLLETRNLDFKNLIVLSVNENIIPAAKSQNSFIPFDIAQAFGLPTYRERDAVFAYHFYRMIQRAENVSLIYNTESDEFGKGEKSRYITQLIEELDSPNTTIHSEIFISGLPKDVSDLIKIEKTPDLISKIANRYNGESEKNRLSPTALSTYFRCGLQYYFRYFSGIKIDETKDEEIGANELGDIAHHVLEIIFADYLNKVLDEDAYVKMKLQLDHVLEEALFIENSGRNYDEGKAILIKHGISKMLHQYLASELRLKNRSDVSHARLLSIEKQLSRSIKVNTILGEKEIHLGGKADRIEIYDKSLRVIDYKTGLVESSKLKLKDLSEVFEKEGMDKALQLLQYIFLAMKEYPNQQVEAGIISLRKPSAGLTTVTVNNDSRFDEENESQLEKLFIEIVESITNPANSFEQTNDFRICAHCDFAILCNR